MGRRSIALEPRVLAPVRLGGKACVWKDLGAAPQLAPLGKGAEAASDGRPCRRSAAGRYGQVLFCFVSESCTSIADIYNVDLVVASADDKDECLDVNKIARAHGPQELKVDAAHSQKRRVGGPVHLRLIVQIKRERFGCGSSHFRF